MAYSVPEYYLKNSDYFYTNASSANKCSISNINTDCVNEALYTNKQNNDKLKEQISKNSALNENYESIKVKYYNEYIYFANMSFGIIGLSYYVYFLMKNNK
jgi:hypothetical protein